MQHIDVTFDDEFAQAAIQAREAGVSVESWVRNLVRRATLPTRPADPLFGLLSDELELADAIDAVVAERSRRAFDHNSCGSYVQ